MSNENYTPFGAEWHKEMKKHSKDVLIEMLKSEWEKPKEQTFTETQISALQHEVHAITGNGPVMGLFNKLLCVSAAE